MAAMPPKIVIGLTGPFCSGCSTLARFFDDPDETDRERGNNFLEKLIKRGLVLQGSEGLEVNWKNANKKIADKLDEYERIKSACKEDKITIQQKHLEQEQTRIFKELGRLLEQRESLKILPFLEPFYPKGKPHLFRTLLMSDIIVFRALVEIAQGRSSKHKEEFDPLAKDAIEKVEDDFKSKTEIQNLQIETINDFYTKISKSDPPKELIRAFKVIHREVRSLRRELMKTTKGRDIKILQEFGNNIRRYGNPFGQGDDKPSQNCVRLAQEMEKVINLIYEAEEATFFVVDCLRNTNEILYFRQRFPHFYLVSIFAEREIRFQRRFRDLMVKDVIDEDQKVVEEEFNERDKLDSGEQNKNEKERTYKQDVTRCVQLSDYAINNMEDRSDAEGFLYDKLLRLVSLILCPGSSKPRKEEVYMNMAYAMAVKSNCICRQVGAVIAGEDGYIVGAGWNDVASGEISCGLRNLCDLDVELHKHIRNQVRKDDKDKTHLEKEFEPIKGSGYKKYPLDQACFCFKEEMAKNEVMKRLDKVLDSEDLAEIKHLKQEHRTDIENIINKAKLHQPEYCIALHAEENTIIQGSRIGGPGIRGSTIYTTAQPCTLCAKKIKQVGISKVVYTDPYPKSEPKIFMNDVILEQFEGVKPRAYVRLFMPNLDQKEWQNLEVNNTIPGFDFNSKAYLFELG